MGSIRTRAKKLFVLSGPQNSTVPAPPLMMLRLARMAVDEPSHLNLESLIRRHAGVVTLPAPALRRLAEISGKPVPAAHSRSKGLVEVPLLMLWQHVGVAIGKGSYRNCLSVFREHRSSIHFALPLPLANRVKRSLDLKLRQEELSWPGGQTIIESRCGLPSPAKLGVCRVKGQTHEKVSKEWCDKLAETLDEPATWEEGTSGGGGGGE